MSLITIINTYGSLSGERKAELIARHANGTLTDEDQKDLQKILARAAIDEVHYRHAQEARKNGKTQA